MGNLAHLSSGRGGRPHTELVAMRRRFLVGGLIACLGVLGIGFLFFGRPGSIRSAVMAHYPCRSIRDSFGSQTLVCRGSQDPLTTADYITQLLSPVTERDDA